MSRPLPQLSANAAFFIDFDGTLVDIAPRPDLVVVEPRVRGLLVALRAHYGQAVALVTGRPLETVDAFIAPLKLPVAAEHGSVRRDAAGIVHTETAGIEAVRAAARQLEPLVAANPGLLLERKMASVALHYRQRPDLAKLCAEVVGEAAGPSDGLVILAGKMVYELRPAGIDKGTAVAAFLGEAPFRGRVPVYAGDDVTDEHAFAAVNEAGGVTIKIGDGETVAAYRTDRRGLLAWAEGLVA